MTSIGLSSIQSQAVYEHTYENSIAYAPIEIEEHGTFYMIRDDINYISLYWSDHTLYKSILVNYNDFILVSIASKLVNSDSGIEVIASFWNLDHYDTRIVDENGNLIQKISGQTWVVSIDGDYKLQAFHEGNTSYYDLPGGLPVSVSDQPSSFQAAPYPNPAERFITLPYDLPIGQKAEMIITNVTGRSVEEFEITGSFSDIRLDVSHYKPGIYCYTVYAKGSSPQSAKFIVQ